MLSGHVHNYQRFSRTSRVGNKSIETPYIIAGAGGYANDQRSLHKLQKELTAQPTPIRTTREGIILQKYQDREPGFLRITAGNEKLFFEYFVVPFSGGPATLFDSVEV